MNNELFTVALGLSEPWVVTALEFDQSERKLIVRVDFRRGARFAHGDAEGVHPVHDTLIKSFRHLSFFQHECELVARVPRVRLPDGRVALVEPPWAGRRSGFTLLFEALVVTLCQQMPFAAAARLARLSPHRAQSICACYVDMAVAQTDLSETSSVAIDETSPGAWPQLRHCRRRRQRSPRRLRRRGAQRQDRRRVRRRAGGARRRSQGGRIGLHRHVARIHQRRRRASAQRRYHLRQVPRSRPRLQGARRDPAHRAAERPGSQGPAIGPCPRILATSGPLSEPSSMRSWPMSSASAQPVPGCTGSSCGRSSTASRST